MFQFFGVPIKQDQFESSRIRLPTLHFFIPTAQENTGSLPIQCTILIHAYFLVNKCTTSSVNIYMINIFNHSNDLNYSPIDPRATELFTLRLTPEDKHKIWIISEHFKISMSRVVHEGLWHLFPLAEKMMKKQNGPNFFK